MPSRFRISAILGLALGLAFCGVYFSAILQPLEERLLDQQQKLPVSAPPSHVPLVFIGIEDMEETPWPWPRLDYTLIANALRRYYPKLVAFEVPLDQPDTLYPVYDTQLAQYLSRLSLVVLAGSAQFSEVEMPYPPEDVPPLLLDLPPSFLEPYNAVKWPLSAFREYASMGLQNFVPDDDGVVRRVPLLFRIGPNLYPSFSLQCYAQFIGAHWPNCKVVPGKSVTLRDPSGKVLSVIPMDESGQTRLRYRDIPPYIPHFEFKDTLLASEQALGTSPPVYDLTAMRNKLVLIGRNHPGAIPYLKTPLGDSSPALIHLTALIDFFSNDFITNLFPLWACAWLLALSLIMAFLPCWTSPGSGLALCSTLLAVTAALSFVLFDAFNLWSPTLTLIVAGFSSWFASMLAARALPPKAAILALPEPSSPAKTGE